MPKIGYSHRLLFDKHFFSWLKSLSDEYARAKYDTLKFVSIIHTTSEHYPRYHNIILNEHFKMLIDTGIMTYKELSWCASDEALRIWQPTDTEVSKVIKLGVALSNARPFKVALITSPDRVNEYAKNPHMTGVNDVIIKGGVDAIAFINTTFRGQYEKAKKV
jgi:hypothetical protein